MNTVGRGVAAAVEAAVRAADEAAMEPETEPEADGEVERGLAPPLAGRDDAPVGATPEREPLTIEDFEVSAGVARLEMIPSLLAGLN